MNAVQYKGRIWASKNKEFDPSLLQLLTSKNHLIVLRHGKPPYRVTLGGPHQAKVGEEHICDKTKKRPSDENAASYALVAYTSLIEKGVSCKLVIAAHSTEEDPNKNSASLYCKEIFREKNELLLECHGAKKDRAHDLELSAGANTLANTITFGHVLVEALGRRYKIAIQKEPEKNQAVIITRDRSYEGTINLAANDTTSLMEANKLKIPAFHLEAKPAFRIPKDRSNTVTPDGLVLGRALAQAIVNYHNKNACKQS